MTQLLKAFRVVATLPSDSHNGYIGRHAVITVALPDGPGVLDRASNAALSRIAAQPSLNKNRPDDGTDKRRWQLVEIRPIDEGVLVVTSDLRRQFIADVEDRDGQAMAAVSVSKVETGQPIDVQDGTIKSGNVVIDIRETEPPKSQRVVTITVPPNNGEWTMFRADIVIEAPAKS